MIVANRSVTQELMADGYCLVSGEEFGLDQRESEAFTEFAEAWSDLPADRYMPADRRYRFRRHGRYQYTSSNLNITRLPDGAYYQSQDDNSLFGGQQRVFAPLKPKTADNDFLVNLLRFNIQQLPIFKPKWEINVHLVRITGSQQEVGEPVPEGFHRDGFAFVSMHLVERRNVIGGETEVVSHGGTPVMKGVLSTRLDSLYLDDRILMHYTSPISSPSMERAHRDMLLISYDESI